MSIRQTFPSYDGCLFYSRILQNKMKRFHSRYGHNASQTFHINDRNIDCINIHEIGTSNFRQYSIPFRLEEFRCKLILKTATKTEISL